MASVLRTYRDMRLPSHRFTFHVTYDPDARLFSVLPFVRALRTLGLAPRERIGIAHVHLSKGGSFVREGALVTLAARRGIPVVVTLHSGAGLAFVREHPRLARAVLRRADRIFAVTEADAASLGRFLRGAEVGVLPNPVRLPDDPPPAAGTRPVALFVGSVSRAKGIDTLLEAWTRVRRADPAAELLVAGPGAPEGTRLPEGVVLLGPVPPEEVSRRLCEARVAVLPSRVEALPVFVLEAMAHGRPVVATPVGALPELLPGCGDIVGVGDVDGLAEALLRYLEEPALAGEVGARGRARARSSFAMERIAGELERIYAEVAAERSR